MKRKVMLCGLVLVLGLLALGCGGDDGSVIPGPPANPYTGTTWSWPNGDEITFTTDSEWLRVNDDDSEIKGTYTYPGAAIILKTTNQRSNSSAQWAAATGEDTVIVAGIKMVKENGDILTNKDAEEGEGPFNGAYKYSGNTGNTVLIFISDSAWLLIDTSGGLGRRGTYTHSGYANNFDKITLTQTGYSHDFGATWVTGGAPYYGTVGEYQNTITIDNMNGVVNMMLTKQL